MNTMSLVNVFPPLLVALTFLIILFILNKVYKIQIKPLKYQSIDGLRGYLAFFVFLHHTYVYSYFTRNSTSKIINSNVINQLGDVSVTLFFMITGFLFTSKLLNEKSHSMDWLKLYVSRILRLYPVYLVLFGIQLIIIFYSTDFKLIQPPLLILKELFMWLTFSIIDYLPINGFQNTNQITANVLWTIRYELFFYCCLPIISWFISKSKPSILLTIVVSVLAVYIGFKLKVQLIFVYTFSIGIITAFLSRNHTICKVASTKLLGIISLICYVSVMILFSSSYEIIPTSILSITFIVIACGNDLGGLLSLSISRLLGQLSYSIYLLHGITLYIIFVVIIGHEKATNLTDYEYWIVIHFSSFLLIIITITSFKFIESPFIKEVSTITGKIRKMLTSSSS